MDEPKAIRNYRVIEEQITTQLAEEQFELEADHIHKLVLAACMCRGRISQWEADQAAKSVMPGTLGTFHEVSKVPC